VEAVMKRIVAAAAFGVLVLSALPADAETAYLTAPIAARPGKVSLATTPKEYRLDVARHIYDSYPDRIFKGRLPPLIHAVVVLETTVDEQGRPREVKVVRGPSHAPDVTAAVREMTFRVGPLPLPSKLGSPVRFIEIWLVHKNGRFQLDALTEGQD
jgi:hypothetical protein